MVETNAGLISAIATAAEQQSADSAEIANVSSIATETAVALAQSLKMVIANLKNENTCVQ